MLKQYFLITGVIISVFLVLFVYVNFDALSQYIDRKAYVYTPQDSREIQSIPSPTASSFEANTHLVVHPRKANYKVARKNESSITSYIGLFLLPIILLSIGVLVNSYLTRVPPPRTLASRLGIPQETFINVSSIFAISLIIAGAYLYLRYFHQTTQPSLSLFQILTPTPGNHLMITYLIPTVTFIIIGADFIFIFLATNLKTAFWSLVGFIFFSLLALYYKHIVTLSTSLNPSFIVYFTALGQIFANGLGWIRLQYQRGLYYWPFVSPVLRGFWNQLLNNPIFILIVLALLVFIVKSIIDTTTAPFRMVWGIVIWVFTCVYNCVYNYPTLSVLVVAGVVLLHISTFHHNALYSFFVNFIPVSSELMILNYIPVIIFDIISVISIYLHKRTT